MTVALSKQTVSVFLNQHSTENHKNILVRRMTHSQHGKNVNGDVAKTDDKTLMYCVFSRITEFKIEYKMYQNVV